MKSYKFTINGNNYHTNVLNVEDNIAEIEVNGTVYKVEVDKQMKQQKTPKLVRPAALPAEGNIPSVSKSDNIPPIHGNESIKSPLPGVILDVFVKEGEQVNAGQKLLLLEAMKMENTIEADRSGKVISIKKQKGDAVMQGDELIVIGV